MKTLIRPLLLAAVLLTSSLSLQAQGGPSPRVRAAVQGIESMLTSVGDSALNAFAENSLAVSYRNSFQGDSLLRHLGALRDAVGEIGGVTVRRDSTWFYSRLKDAKDTVRFSLVNRPHHVD